MSEFKVTKGKWLFKYVNGFIKIISKENGLDILDTYDNQKDISNALLISKAPEMLEMLESVLKLQKENYGSGVNTHLAMITKAKAIEQLIKEATEL